MLILYIGSVFLMVCTVWFISLGRMWSLLQLEEASEQETDLLDV